MPLKNWPQDVASFLAIIWNENGTLLTQKHIGLRSTGHCSRATTITKCIDDFLDAEYIDCKAEEFNNFSRSCSIGDLSSRAVDAMTYRMSGYQELVNVTGCKLPCTRYGYELTTGKMSNF